jgi:hypothetical protein
MCQMGAIVATATRRHGPGITDHACHRDWGSPRAWPSDRKHSQRPDPSGHGLASQPEAALSLGPPRKFQVVIIESY